MKADCPAMEGTPFPEVKLAELPEEAKVEIVFPVEVTTYTLADGKIKKVESTGETKEVPDWSSRRGRPYMVRSSGPLAMAASARSVLWLVADPGGDRPAEKMDADGDGGLTADEIFQRVHRECADVTLERVERRSYAASAGRRTERRWEEVVAKDPGLVPAAWLAAAE